MSRKKIAVITARADDRTQKDIICGIAEAAFAADADVAVFSNIYNHWIRDEFLNFENVIYDFFDPSGFDGVIVTAEAFLDISMLSPVYERVRKSGIPAVVIGGDIEGFQSVYSDDGNDMERLCEHLITVHKFRDIDILTGPKDNIFSYRRLEGCKRAFEKHGIPFGENKVFFGSFWYDSGKRLAERYLMKELPMPQAVICANDCMAYALCDALSAAGVPIPETVTVTGYDCTGERIYHYPVLTTYLGDRRNVGIMAVNRLLSSDHPLGNADRFISGNTCACGINPLQLCSEMAAERIDKQQAVLGSIAQFSSDIALCRTLAEYMTVLSNYFYLLHGASKLFICLDTEWNSAEYRGDDFLCCATDYEKLSSAPLITPKERLLSSVIGGHEKPAVFYFSPLHFQKRLFGCTVTAYETPNGYDFSFRDWNKTIANALEIMRMKNDIHYLTQCRRTSSLYDALTGFCKMREFQRCAAEAASDKSGLLAVKIGFPQEYDCVYGDALRSDIIAAAARTVKQACTELEIYGRTDDDILVILCGEKRGTVFEKIKVTLHHELCGKYGENQAMMSFAEQAGCTPSDIEKVCRAAEDASAEAEKLLRMREKLTQYKSLLELRSGIIADPRHAPDIDAASRRLCVSVGYFGAIYKKCFGKSYVQDCINEKIMLARYLLCTTVMSVYAVAMQCGYTDEKYFARQFRRNMGCSPIQYRKWLCRSDDDIV